MEGLGLKLMMGVTLITIGFAIGTLIVRYKDFKFDHRIYPTEIRINQQTGDTTFVYIMK